MRRLSSGDVELKVPATADRDEIGEMARALEVFRDGEIERRSYAERQSKAQAALVGQQGKPESYYFPPQLNAVGNNFPYTFFGLEPGTTKTDIVRCLEDLAGHCKIVKQIFSHTNNLRALSRENVRGLSHLSLQKPAR